jgi:hypothetical protein
VSEGHGYQLVYIYMGELDKFSHRIYIRFSESLCQLMLLLFLLLFSCDEVIKLLIFTLINENFNEPGFENQQLLYMQELPYLRTG